MHDHGLEKHVDKSIEEDVCECGGKLHKHRIIDWNRDIEHSIYNASISVVNYCNSATEALLIKDTIILLILNRKNS